MERFLFAYWWLVFPLMWFVFGLFGMWTRYAQHRNTLDLMKRYADQGKDPTEIAKALGAANDPTYPHAPGFPSGRTAGPWAYGPGDRAWRYRRWDPLRDWRRTIVFACLATGFWVASEYSGLAGAEPAFRLVAIIMGALAAGSLLFALLSLATPRPPPDEK